VVTCIAIIDDNIVSQRFMCELFAERGWDSIALSTGQEVESTLLTSEASRPDVVILDLHLAERDAGVSVLCALKSHAGTRDVPVIMCSGDVWALQTLAESVRADLAAILVKPFEIDQAYQCIEFVLGSGAPVSQN
jgi:CheY-like chemotaxis protein